MIGNWHQRKVFNLSTRRDTKKLCVEALEPRVVLSADAVVTFNEVMYNPADSDQTLEWVELRNQMSVDVELSGWRLDDGVNFQFADGTVLEAGGHLVIAADAAALQTATGFADAVGSYTGQLSNGGERVVLRDHNNRLMDEIDYSDGGDWPVAPDGSGSTLAKMSPNLASGEVASWTHSAEIGGTPGAFNFPVSSGPMVNVLEQWNVDIQGDAGSTTFGQEGLAHPHGPDASGVWNIFNVPPLDGDPTTLVTDPSLNLVDKDGDASSVTFSIIGDVGGWSGNPGADTLIGDYIILLANGGLGYPDSLGMNLSGLDAGATYELIVHSAENSARDMQTTFDIDGDGSLADETPATTSGGGATQSFLFTANGSGTLVGEITTATNNEANLSGIQLKKIEAGASGVLPDSLDLRFNEVAGAADASFFVELHNDDDSSIDLTGYTITATGLAGGSYEIPSGSIPVGGYLSIDEATLGFHPQDEDAIFLYNADDTAVLDAARVKNSLRGRSDQHEGRWQRPDTGTPGAANNFSFHDEIVINEIMYHNYPIQPTEEVVQTTTVVEFDDAWRYNQAGIDLGTSWAQSSHAVDGASWFSGDGLLAVENSPLPETVNTTLSLGPKTFYFETDFNFNGNLADINELRLSHVIDDGAAFYLNGVEILRYNMNGNVGDPVLAGDDAKEVVNNATKSGTISVPADQLLVGNNRLSVEVHQKGNNSSDIVMGAELELVEVSIQGTAFAEDTEEWIELVNKSGQTVDLSGWQLDDAVSHIFAAGTTIGAGQYIVVARDAVALAAKYPSITIAGEYNGKLSNSDERIQLLDASKNIADEVHYYDSGRWNDLADGSGSSLELRDPDADNSKAEAWDASDETDKSAWQTVTYTATASTPALSYNIWDEFVLGLLGAGEVLVDDISVIRDPGGAGVELIQNGNFNNGTTSSWRLGGNHKHSQIVPDPENASNNVLHLIATGSAEHILNHAETTLAGGESIQPGTEYQISYRAKWLNGSNQVNSRLYFNYLPNTTRLDVPRDNGTPGGQNSQADINVGPTYENFQHGPVTPTANEAVTVSVKADDPDGVTSVTLYYSVNEGSFSTVAMTNVGGGRYEAAIPGQSNNNVVQFYLEGTDGLGASSTFPAEGEDSRALYKVGIGSGVAGLNRLQIIMLPSESSLLHEPTNTFSNDAFGGTVVAENNEVFYGVGTRMKGSSYGRNNNGTKGFRIEFGGDQLYRGVHDSVTINRDGKKEIIAKHLIASAGGVPSFYDDVIDFVSASGSFSGRALLNMARYGDTYRDSQFDNGSDGNVFNLELLYTPTTTVGGVESTKLSFPYTHTNGLPDFTYYGADQELYRYNFQLKNNSTRDDFSGLIDFLSIFDLSSNDLAIQAPLHMDVDQWARTFAAQSLNGTDDTYTRTPSVHHAHNLRFYERPEDGLFLAMPWDLDRSFNLSTSAPLWGNNGSLPALFNLPTVKRLFYGHLDEMIQTTFNSSELSSWATHYGSLTGENYSGVVNYVQNRANYVQSQLPSLAPFNITTNGGAGFSTSASQVTIEGSGSYKIRELKLNGNPNPIEVTWTGETTWEATFPIAPGANALTFRAIDFFGNEIQTDSITVTSTATTPLADATNLRITELNYNPHDANLVPGLGEMAVDNDEFEFVELTNISQVDSIELSGVQFLEVANGGGTDGITFTFGATTLAPGEHILVVKNQAAFESRFGTGLNIAGEYSGKLSNGGELITLRDTGGTDIQSFEYNDSGSWPGRADGKGASLEAIDLGAGLNALDLTTLYDSATNWRSSNEYGGSPDAVGTGPVFDVIVNEVLSHSDGAALDEIELYNTTGASIDISKWYLSESGSALFAQHQITGGTSLGSDQYLVLNETQLGFALDGQNGDDLWLIEADNVTGKPLRFAQHLEFDATDTDVSLGLWPNGDPNSMLFPMTSQSFGGPNSGPVFGEVLISEVHYNPAAIPPAEVGNIAQGELEFVEIVNNSGAAKPIDDWKVEGINFTFPVGTTLADEEAIVIVTFDPVLEPAKATAFRNVHGIGGSPRLFGPATGQLNNAGETVRLLKPEDPVTLLTGDVLVDAVNYDATAPWPIAADGSGKSLTRTSPTDYAPLVTSWTAEDPTPGSVNFAVPNNPPTVANPIADVSVFEDAADSVLDLLNVFDDIDVGDVLTLTVTGNTNGSLVSTNLVGTTLTLDYGDNQNGTANITIRATDLDGAFIEDTFLVTVDPTPLGDMNGDGLVNTDDLNPFVQALTNRAAYDAAYPLVDADIVGNVNEDGAFNLGDRGPVQSVSCCQFVLVGFEWFLFQ